MSEADSGLFSQPDPQEDELFSQPDPPQVDLDMISFISTTGSANSFNVKVQPHAIHTIGYGAKCEVRLIDRSGPGGKGPGPDGSQLLSSEHAVIKVAASGVYLVVFGKSGCTVVCKAGKTTKLSPGQKARLFEGDIVNFGSNMSVPGASYTYFMFSVSMPGGKTYGTGPHTSHVPSKTCTSPASLPKNRDKNLDKNSLKRKQRATKKKARVFAVVCTKGRELQAAMASSQKKKRGRFSQAAVTAARNFKKKAKRNATGLRGRCSSTPSTVVPGDMKGCSITF